MRDNALLLAALAGAAWLWMRRGTSQAAQGSDTGVTYYPPPLFPAQSSQAPAGSPVPSSLQQGMPAPSSSVITRLPLAPTSATTATVVTPQRTAQAVSTVPATTSVAPAPAPSTSYSVTGSPLIRDQYL